MEIPAFAGMTIEPNVIYVTIVVNKNVILGKVRTMRSLAFIVFISCLIGSADAQQRFHFYYGKVIDQVSGKAIPDANIAFKGSKKGTSTDSKGDFSFYMDVIPIIMVVSHLGYETKKVYLDKTSFSLVVYLQPASVLLNEVVVTGKSEVEPVFREEHFNVLDFKVDTMNIYVLVSDNRNYQEKVICLNLSGDTMAVSEDLDVSPSGLFRDCLGNLHALTDDSAYQVFGESHRLSLIYPVSRRKFREVLENCVLATPKDLYFKKPDRTGQSVSYARIDRKTSEKQMLTTIEDSLKNKMLRRNSRDLELLLRSEIPSSRQDFVDWSYVHKVLYKPMSTYLCKIGDFICVVNASDMTIEFYNMDGNYASKLFLQIRETGGEGSWTKEIYIDESDEKVYTSFLKNGFSSIYRIDLNTGELKRKTRLFHPFPEKTQIERGYVFYLYHSAGSGENRSLYREKF